MKDRNKRRILRGLCAVLAAMVLPWCARAEEIPQLIEPAGVKLDTAVVRAGEMKKITVYAACVVPHAEGLSFAVDGTVEAVNVIVGQKVRAGDVLMTLDTEAEDERRESLEKQLDALKTDAAYADALAELDRSILQLELEMLGSGGADEKTVALKKLELEQFELDCALERQLTALKTDRLRSEIAQLEAEAGKASLIAPFDGRVVFLADVQTGSRIGAYSALMYLADDSRLSIRSEYISDGLLGAAHDVYALTAGGRCEVLHVPADQKEYISRVLAGESPVSEFEIGPGGEDLAAGDYAALCVENGYVEHALIVPANALYSDASGRYVYVEENGARVRRKVTTGIVSDWEAQILEGLQEGEVVYVQD